MKKNIFISFVAFQFFFICGCKNNMTVKYNYHNSFSNIAYSYEIKCDSGKINVEFQNREGKIENFEYDNYGLLNQIYLYFSHSQIEKTELEAEDYENRFEIFIGEKRFLIISLKDDFSETYPECYDCTLILKLHKQILSIANKNNYE